MSLKIDKHFIQLFTLTVLSFFLVRGAMAEVTQESAREVYEQETVLDLATFLGHEGRKVGDCYLEGMIYYFVATEGVFIIPIETVKQLPQCPQKRDYTEFEKEYQLRFYDLEVDLPCKKSPDHPGFCEFDEEYE